MFVADDLVAWLIGLLADASRKRLPTAVFGSDQERELREAATAALTVTANKMCCGDEEKAERLAMVVSQVFDKLMLYGYDSIFEAIQTGIAEQLAPLSDADLTGVGVSSADLLGITGPTLADELTASLVREIVVRGIRGKPLAALANQLNHDLTHLNAQRLLVIFTDLASDVREAMERVDDRSSAGSSTAVQGREPQMSARRLQRAIDLGYVVDSSYPQDRNHIVLGMIKEGSGQQKFTIPASIIRERVLIAGSRATNKTAAIMHILRNLNQVNVPWLLLETSQPFLPRDELIRAFRGRLAAMDQEPDSAAITVDPCAVEFGFQLRRHIELLSAITTLSFKLDGATSRLVGEALKGIYAACHWSETDVAGEKVRSGKAWYPDIFRLDSDLRYNSNYKKLVQDESQWQGDRLCLAVLLQQMRSGYSKYFFRGNQKLDVPRTLEMNFSFRTSDAPSAVQNLMVGVFLLRVFEYIHTTRTASAPGLPKHVTFLRSLSGLMPNPSAYISIESAQSVLSNMIMEMGDLGEGIILDEEFPARLAPEILETSGLKIIFGLRAYDDRDAACRAINADESMRDRLSGFDPSTALVLAPGMDKPMEVEIR